MPFLGSLDIANRAIQMTGGTQIASVTEDSKNNFETTFAYDKLRRAELRRNTWRFAIRNVCLRAVDTNTMILQPAAWSSTVEYQPGAIVSDANGQLWLSMAQQNINNAPGGNNEVWDTYFGPLTIEPFASSTTYFAGELVYTTNTATPTSPPLYTIFQSLENANADVPNTATPWSSTTQYNGSAVVSYSGQQWSSLVEINLNNTPATGPLPWSATTAYTIGQTVAGADNYIYSSVGSNTGNNPVGDGGVHWTNTGAVRAWELSPTQAAASTNWRPITASMRNLAFSYPLGSGPSSQASTRNVFRLPSGYLREAPQDPKAGSTSYLGAPSGNAYDDWEFSGNFIVSACSDPIIFRFVADITKVSAMDDMFCEGLACRIAIGICPALTQSEGKLQTLAGEYKQFMGDARTVNAIETGAVEPPLDDYIACRA